MPVLTLLPSRPKQHFPTSFAKQSRFPPTQCIFLSFPCPGSTGFVWRKAWNPVSRRLLCYQKAPLPKKERKYTQPIEPAYTHLSPRLTNVPWHSYITRKLAKWIKHGPCLALRALNGFSPLQVCPVIAFIHLVEARFTHSQRSCQSPDAFSALMARVWEICHWIITGNSNNN